MEKGGLKPVFADRWFSWLWFDAVKKSLKTYA